VRGGKRYEIAGDVRQEKPLQPEKSRRVDKPRIETKQLKLTTIVHHRPLTLKCTDNVSISN
jgi:hypothetical protein